jgi:hypothetical protein
MNTFFAMPIFMDSAVKINTKDFLIRNLLITWGSIGTKSLAKPTKFCSIAFAEIVIEFD